MISREIDYAIRIITFLETNQEKNLLNATSTLSEELNIPCRFARKIISKLNKKGFLNTKLGKFGGIKLNLQSKEISVLDIIEAFSSSNIYINKCFKDGKLCGSKTECKLHNELSNIQKDLYMKLSNIKIGNLKFGLVSLT